jgi:hypothetical protein
VSRFLSGEHEPGVRSMPVITSTPAHDRMRRALATEPHSFVPLLLALVFGAGLSLRVASDGTIGAVGFGAAAAALIVTAVVVWAGRQVG